MDFIKVAEDTTLVRDPTTGAILNTNKDAQLDYRRAKMQRNNQLQRLDIVERNIDEIRGVLDLILTKLG